MDHEQALDELNLGPEATEEEIRAAHKALARERHPDVAGDRDGDGEEMKRLNQARDIAIHQASELVGADKQELVLRRLFELQSNQQEREAAQRKGRELVAGAATIQIGRLRRLQRRASLIAVIAAMAAGVVALVRAAGPAPSAMLDAYVGALALFAVLAGVYRTFLSERINQIQLSLEDLGSTLMRRATYASVFRAIVDGLLDREAFEEEEVIQAVGLWSATTLDSEWIERRDVEDGGGGQIFVSLRALTEKVGFSQGELLALSFRTDLDFYRSERGIQFLISDLLTLDEGEHHGTNGRNSWGEQQLKTGSTKEGIPWVAIQEAVRRATDGRHLRVAPDGPPEARAPLTLYAALRSTFFRDEDQDPERRLRRLGREIGAVDLARLLIGKGLENDLLAEEETVDEQDRLLTTYRFQLQHGRQAQAGALA